MIFRNCAAPFGDLEVRNLDRADLSRSNFFSANLTGATLTRANLTGADLTGANLIEANLTGVIWSNTTCPDGQVQSTECPPRLGGGGGI